MERNTAGKSKVALASNQRWFAAPWEAVTLKSQKAQEKWHSLAGCVASHCPQKKAALPVGAVDCSWEL